MHILVLANRTCPCPELHDFVHLQIGDHLAEVTVVAPALNSSKVAHWVSDSDEAFEDAEVRLAQAVDGLKGDGIAVRGQVGDADPLTALEDALSLFEADAVVISTFPAGESHWQEKGLLKDARARLSVPVHHFVTEYGLEEARRDETAN